MIGYLEDDHWLHNARHANAMAQTLTQGLNALGFARLPWPTQANEVFVVVPKAKAKALSEAGIRAAPWESISLPAQFEIGADDAFLRFVLSFKTTPSEIDRVIATLKA
jgi:threonine aldolase